MTSAEKNPDRHLSSVSRDTFGPLNDDKTVAFANPNLRCGDCDTPVAGFTWFTHELVPCGHVAAVVDTCPSWSPVDGCSCEDMLGKIKHRN
jgi:hypothetical protein